MQESSLAQRVAILLVGFLLLGGGSYFFLFRPVMADLKVVKAKTVAVEEEVEQYSERNRRFQAISDEEKATLLAKAKELESRIPVADDIDILCTDIATLGKKAGAVRVDFEYKNTDDTFRGDRRILGRRPAATAQPGEFEELSLKVYLTASYPALTAFVDELPRLQRLVKISKLSVERLPPLTKATMDLKTFRRIREETREK